MSVRIIGVALGLVWVILFGVGAYVHLREEERPIGWSLYTAVVFGSPGLFVMWRAIVA